MKNKKSHLSTPCVFMWSQFLSTLNMYVVQMLLFPSSLRKFVLQKIGPFEVSISHFRIVTFLLSCGEITKKIWVKLCSKDSFTHSSRVTIVRNCFTLDFKLFQKFFPPNLLRRWTHVSSVSSSEKRERGGARSLLWC